MKILNLITILICLFSMLSFSAYAGTQQKMIVVKGQNSYLMDGDPYTRSFNKPLNYRKDEVLPSLLSKGWRIISVHVNKKSTASNLYGYVVIEITN